MPLTIAVTPTSSTSSREVAVVHIVGIAHERVAHISKGLHGGQSGTITMIRSVTKIGVGLQTASGTLFDGELHHEVILTIIDACQP